MWYTKVYVRVKCVLTHIAHAVEKESHPALITVVTVGLLYAAFPKVWFVCQSSHAELYKDVTVVGSCAVQRWPGTCTASSKGFLARCIELVVSVRA